MRTFLLLVCFIALGVAQPAGASEPVDPGLQPLTWMLGSWQRVGLPEGTRGYERWHVSDGAFVGTGIKLKGKRVVFEEKLRLETDNGGVFYVADVAENAKPVRFRLVAQTEHSAVFENPEHDFPKKIAYRVDGDLLEVITSGDGRDIVFRFKRSSETDVN